MYKKDNHTEEVRLYLNKGENEKAFKLSLLEKRLRLAAIMSGTITLAIGVAAKVLHG
jgi:hypothetical protein